MSLFRTGPLILGRSKLGFYLFLRHLGCPPQVGCQFPQVAAWPEEMLARTHCPSNFTQTCVILLLLVRRKLTGTRTFVLANGVGCKIRVWGFCVAIISKIEIFRREYIHWNIKCIVKKCYRYYGLLLSKMFAYLLKKARKFFPKEPEICFPDAIGAALCAWSYLFS